MHSLVVLLLWVQWRGWQKEIGRVDWLERQAGQEWRWQGLDMMVVLVVLLRHAS